MPSAPTTGRASRRSWFVWLSAAGVYLFAVFHRTSFGVAGIEATERFGVGAAALGTFTVLQVGVYAAMQIPTGVLVDRYGPRRVLTFALLFLGLGQILLAVATSYPLGLLARAVLGFGDALTFVSVLRLIAGHFPGRQYSLVTSFTTAIGYLGNLAATVPLTLLLAGPGWTPTFLTAGVLTVAYVLVARFRLEDLPAGAPRPEPMGRIRPRSIGRQIAVAWRTPGTRLGFWVHFSTMFGANVLAMLWGLPYLVAQGISAPAASGLLTVFVFTSLFGGPFLGSVISKHPSIRMPLVVGYLSLAGLAWAVLLAWPGAVPVAVVIPVFVVLALGGPASMIGFALARDYNPLSRVGTATGVVNVGGFVATTLAALGIGVLLELTGGQFRIALLVVVVLLLFGSFRTLVWWRRTRAVLFAAQARGEQIPVQVRRRRWDEARPVPAAA